MTCKVHRAQNQHVLKDSERPPKHSCKFYFPKVDFKATSKPQDPPPRNKRHIHSNCLRFMFNVNEKLVLKQELAANLSTTSMEETLINTVIHFNYHYGKKLCSIFQAISKAAYSQR